jgi:hypothetical protein
MRDSYDRAGAIISRTKNLNRRSCTVRWAVMNMHEADISSGGSRLPASPTTLAERLHT